MQNFTRIPSLLVVAILACGAFLMGGCESNPDGPPEPAFESFTVKANPHMITAVIVEATVTGVSELTIEYSRDGEEWSSTPSFPTSDGRYAVVGLAAETEYMFRLAAGSSKSAVETFITGEMPLLPDVTLTRTPGVEDPIMPGYLLVGFTGSSPDGAYAAVIYDTAARVVWYRSFGHPVVDFQKQPNGNFTMSVAPLNGPAKFYEVDVFGDEVAVHEAETTPATDVHELRILSDGSRLISGVKRPKQDLTAYGGEADVEVKQCVVEYRNGSELLTWSTELGMLPSDGIDPLVGSEVNPYHLNAIERDTDGNLLVSMRNASQIVKIDVSTGFVKWRLGGKRSDFVLIGDPLFGFSRQHGVRRLANGNIIIFDNGNDRNPQVSRAVEYQLDETFHTATFVGEYRVPDLFGNAMGFAQRLQNGNTVVCFGTARFIREVSPDNRVLWQLHPIGVELPYRAFKVSSLY